MNIAEILKDCPEGTRLYSPIFGEVIFVRSDTNLEYPIRVQTSVGNKCESFTKFGTYISQCPGECMLFPSKNNKDWSTFKVPKKEYDFKPFDKVLVRDENSDIWCVNLFSHYDDEDGCYVCVGGLWKQCIPYEGNEHFLGTTNNPD